MDPVLLRGIPDGIYLYSNFSPTLSFFAIIFFGYAIYFLKFLTTFCTEMELTSFATIDNSKSVRNTNSIFAHKKEIGVTIEKMQKKRNFKILELMGFAKWRSVKSDLHLCDVSSELCCPGAKFQRWTPPPTGFGVIPRVQ